MANQKGQIYIIFLVLFVVGAILYLNFSDRSLLKFILPSTQAPNKPYTPPIPSTPVQLTPGVDGETSGVVVPPVQEPVAPIVPITQPQADITPPVISNQSHRGNVLLPDTREAVIALSTDEPASCKYSTNPETGRYNQMSWYDETKMFHVKTITGLVNGTTYEFFIRCEDFNGNENTGDVLISFRVLP